LLQAVILSQSLNGGVFHVINTALSKQTDSIPERNFSYVVQRTRHAQNDSDVPLRKICAHFPVGTFPIHQTPEAAKRSSRCPGAKIEILIAKRSEQSIVNTRRSDGAKFVGLNIHGENGKDEIYRLAFCFKQCYNVGQAIMVHQFVNSEPKLLENRKKMVV
jgi:hypothetical protein